MVRLSRERIEQILQEDNAKKEELDTILRTVYIRYMLLYEKYFADTEALNDEKIAELREYHEETISLIKYYYMDIPQDICLYIKEFEDKYSNKLLGPDWRKVLFECYDDFREKSDSDTEDEKFMRSEFSKKLLVGFYEEMNNIFRSGFGTESETFQKMLGGLSDFMFGTEK